jgi:hypothetical protein
VQIRNAAYVEGASVAVIDLSQRFQLIHNVLLDSSLEPFAKDLPPLGHASWDITEIVLLDNVAEKPRPTRRDPLIAQMFVPAVGRQLTRDDRGAAAVAVVEDFEIATVLTSCQVGRPTRA